MMDGRDCGLLIYMQVIDRPDVPPDTNCIAQIRRLAWQWLSPESRSLLGNSSLWDDDAP